MKQSLEKRIILFSFLILSMTILANTAMEIAIFRKEYIQEVILRNQSLGLSFKNSIEKVLALGIDIRDVTGLSEKCKELIQADPESTYCSITDINGKTLFVSSPEFAAIESQKIATRAEYAKNVYILKTPAGEYFNIQTPIISYDNKQVATIHIGFPLKAISQKIYPIITRSILIFLVFFSLAFALVVLFVKRSIVAPISLLLDGVNRISQGDFKTDIMPLPVFELDQLGNKINNMAVALDTRDQELTQNYAELSAAHEKLNNSYLHLESLRRDLEKSEELYKKLQEEAGDSIIILDDSEQIIIANKMAESFLAVPASEMLGQHISSLLVRLDAVDIPRYLKKMKEAFTGAYVDDEITIHSSRGDLLTGRIHASCVTIGNKALLQIIIRDITREHEILTNLENSAAGLARLNRMKDSFLGLASHELKTPLTVIMGYSELLLSDMRSELNETATEMVNNISNAALRLDGIVKDMIDVSMIDQKQLELKLLPLQLNTLIEASVRELHFFFALRKLEVKINPDPELPIIRGDHSRLMQLFANILGNAIKFTPDGGHITVTTSHKTYDSLRYPLPYNATMPLTEDKELHHLIEIEISDSGIGINKEDQQRIFDKFFEAGNIEEHSSGKVAFKSRGAGLGLSIAKGVVEMHGGLIRVESTGYDPQACPGSSFIILLPC